MTRQDRATSSQCFATSFSKGRADPMVGFTYRNGDSKARQIRNDYSGVGVAVVHGDSLIVTDDGSNSIWRVSYAKR